MPLVLRHGAPGTQRLVHGGITLGSRKTWTLCDNEEASEVGPRLPEDSPFILMVDRGDCTFASKVCSFFFMFAARFFVFLFVKSHPRALACTAPTPHDAKRVFIMGRGGRGGG